MLNVDFLTFRRFDVSTFALRSAGPPPSFSNPGEKGKGENKKRKETEENKKHGMTR
jgi:hypothetical protein